MLKLTFTKRQRIAAFIGLMLDKAMSPITRHASAETYMASSTRMGFIINTLKQ